MYNYNYVGNCGGIMRIGASGSKEIMSPNYPNNYPSDIECVYRLATDSGRVIRLTINELQTYDSSDYLQVIDGYYVELQFLLASINSSTPAQRVYQSSVNALTLRFIANGANNRKGFRATFDSVEARIEPTTVTRTITETQVSTDTTTQTVHHTITSLSVVSAVSTKTTATTSTVTVYRTRTNTIIATETETETVFRTQTRNLVSSTTTTVTAVSTSTVSTTATVTEQAACSPTPARLLPTGSPTDDSKLIYNYSKFRYVLFLTKHLALILGLTVIYY